MANETENTQLKSGIALAGEYLVPGGANLVAGQYKDAGIHAAAGLLAKVLLGIPGLLVVSANSFSKAVTGQNLWEHLSGATKDNQGLQQSSATLS
jgi:Family of unknown function (DUF6072)